MSYYIWLILAVLAFVIEMNIPTFFALFAGVGFLFSAVVAYFMPESLFWQIIIASVFMLIGALIFKKKHIADSPSSKVGTHNEFVGIEGVVLVSLSAHVEGEVELSEPILGSRRWPALCLDGEAEVGREIKIVELRGNTLVVTKN
ncbi:MAG: NfeD family protein [Sulfurimonas sp.]|nr:NfeD family protein [Sulfurimonas sp.]MBU3939618.1 NfeD family protein [bacterium]MBU4023901.1 NfeD family protein [bacterium]MBU4059743.1 NfeD family protein [bacterium]